MSIPRKPERKIEKPKIEFQRRIISESGASNVCILSNGTVAYVTRDDLMTIRIYDPNKNELVTDIDDLTGYVPDLLPLPGGRLAYTNDYSRQLHVWNPDTGKTDKIFDVSQKRLMIRPFCLVDDNKGLLCKLIDCASPEEKFGVINFATKNFSEFPANIGKTLATAYMWKQYLLTVSGEGRINLWDIRVNKCMATLSDPLPSPAFVTTSLSPPPLVSDLLMVKATALDETITIYDLNMKKAINSFECKFTRGAILLPGDRLAMENNETLQIYDVHSKKLISEFPLPDIAFMQLLPNLNIFIAGYNQTVILDIGLREELQKEFAEYQQTITGNTPITPDPAGVIVEYLVAERKKIFGTRNSDAKTQDTSLSSDEKDKAANKDKAEDQNTPKKSA